MANDLTDINALTSGILSAAIKVHRVLGPGLLESVYTACLAHELREAQFRIVSERRLPAKYGTVRIRCGFRLDVVVNETVIVEVKSVRRLAPIHQAQLLTYLKLTGCPAGLLLNFNVPLMKQGIKRMLNPKPGPVYLG
jgi:GxxExxY protein